MSMTSSGEVSTAAPARQQNGHATLPGQLPLPFAMTLDIESQGTDSAGVSFPFVGDSLGTVSIALSASDLLHLHRRWPELRVSLDRRGRSARTPSPRRRLRWRQPPGQLVGVRPVRVGRLRDPGRHHRHHLPLGSHHLRPDQRAEASTSFMPTTSTSPGSAGSFRSSLRVACRPRAMSVRTRRRPTT